MPDRRDDDEDRETLASVPGSVAPDSTPPEPLPPGARSQDDRSQDDRSQDDVATFVPATPRVPALPETEAPTGEISPLDLESLPPRARSGASASARTAADRSVPARSEATEPGETPRTEVPTSEIEDIRGIATQAGAHAVAGTQVGATRPGGGDDVSEDERATIADAGLSQRQQEQLSREASAARADPDAVTHAPTVGDAAGGSATQRSVGPVPASKYSRGTARDPVAGTSAGRGTLPSARPALTALHEGMLIADRYELVRRLGKGGMGEVWQARHTLLQGMRAIKVIKASISRDPSFRARFLSEGQTMMRVKHDNVVEVTDLDETRQNRELFMVMEHLEGRTMYDAVRDGKVPLHTDVTAAVRIFRELALGIQRIHDERIVHKDLKTDNVLLVKGEDGLEHPKVIDFGLSKRIGEPGDVSVEKGVPGSYGTPDQDLHTTLSGTLAYMSPEQFRGEPSTFQSDIYAYGVMIYECFTDGEYPMPRGSLTEYVQRHRDGSVPRRLQQARPDLDPYLAQLADRCMAPRREDRPDSMAEVAEKLKWWLDAPARAKRRKFVLQMSAAAVLLVGVAVYGFFFKKQQAGVTNLSLARAAGGAPIETHGGRAYLPAGQLDALAFEGMVTGEAGTPSFLVDGAPHAADLRFEPREGRRALVGTMNLSDLPDGEHVLGFRASAGADAATMKVVVDRKPPDVAGVDLTGGRGGFTKADNPVLSIRVAEPQGELRRVFVRVPATRREITADAAPDDGTLWTVRGVHEGEGEQVVEVRAEDRAGNVTAKPFEFRFVRDVQAPSLDVDGLLDGRLQVRDPAGNRFAVRSAEDVEVRTSFLRRGETVPAERTFTTAKSFDVPLPDVPAAGFDVTVVALDRAGNETRRTFEAQVVADEATLLSETGARRVAVRGGEDVVLRVHRTYRLPDEFTVSRVRVRDADGSPAKDASPQVLAGAVPVVDAARPTDAVVRFRADLPQGEYGLTIDGLGGANVAPITLVVDPLPPRFASIVVRDADGRPVADGAWCLTEDVTVEVELDELAPASIALEGSPPEQPPAPGRSKCTFRRRLATQGTNTLNLAARDDSGNDAPPTTVVVLADWTAPTLELTSPRSGDAADDVTQVVFAGRCSESAWKLVVEGLSDGPRTTDHTQAAFADPWLLPAGEQSLVVRAVDPSGRASAPVSVTLRVEKRAVAKRAQTTWSQGVAAEMRRVDKGDVLIDRLTQPVGLVYLDLTEVTNRQYREFLKASEARGAGRAPWDHADQPAGWSHVPAAETWKDPKWSADDLPVVNVAWWDAYAFATWSGRRLPSEGEWVKAAAKSDGERGLRAWPPIPEGAPWKEGLVATAESTKQAGPVDATKGDDVSPAGCLHMGGNVSEWVDLPFARKGDPATGVRGGSFWTSRFGADVARVPTKPYDRSFRARTIGFRCAVDAEQVSQ